MNGVNRIDGWSVVHAFLWFVLTAGLSVLMPLWLAVVIAMAWGVVCELHKFGWKVKLLDRRGFSWMDIVFDAIGVFAYVFIF